MGTITCPAGHIFSDGQVPSPYGWTLISEANVERAVDDIMKLVESGEEVEAEVTFSIFSHGSHTYICPECGRLLVFDRGLDKPSVSYKRE